MEQGQVEQVDIGVTQQDTEKDRYLIFALGNENFGLEIRFVDEIIYMSHITRLPEVPPYIKGIINMRGKVVPVLDVRLKFGKEPIEYNDRTCIIVVDMASAGVGLVGLIVDGVASVETIPLEAIVPPPESSVSVQNSFLSGIAVIDREVKLLLDCKKLLLDDDAHDMV